MTQYNFTGDYSVAGDSDAQESGVGGGAVQPGREAAAEHSPPLLPTRHHLRLPHRLLGLLAARLRLPRHFWFECYEIEFYQV